MSEALGAEHAPLCDEVHWQGVACLLPAHPGGTEHRNGVARWVSEPPYRSGSGRRD